MFAAEVNNEIGIDIIVLTDTISKTFVEIIPSCGAILRSFTIFQNNAPLNVVDSYDNAEDFTGNVTGGFKGCKLSPFACRINKAAYRFREKEYFIEKFLLNGSALHGLLYDSPFTIIDRYADEGSAGVSLKYTYAGSDKGYPFVYDCIVAYHLKSSHELTIITEIINKDNGLIPIQDGWHPYFTFNKKIDELFLQIQSSEIIVFDEQMIPTGSRLPYREFYTMKKIAGRSLDHCFAVDFAGSSPACILKDPEKNLQIEIYPDKHYPYLQIYTPPHRNSIAIENLSAAPDSFNNKIGLIILQPAENIIFTTTFKLTPLI